MLQRRRPILQQRRQFLALRSSFLFEQFLPCPCIVRTVRMHGELALAVDDGAFAFACDNVIERPGTIGFNLHPLVTLGMLEPINQYLKGNHVLVIITETSRTTAGNGTSHMVMCWHCCLDSRKLPVRVVAYISCRQPQSGKRFEQDVMPHEFRLFVWEMTQCCELSWAGFVTAASAHVSRSAASLSWFVNGSRGHSAWV